VLLHDLKVGVWCAVSALMITGCRVFSRNKKFRTLCQIVSPFFDQLMDEEESCGNFMRCNATAFNVNSSVDALDEVLANEIKSRIVASAVARFKCLSVYLWSTLKDKNMYVNNLHWLEELQEIIRYEIFAISLQHLRPVSRNIFLRCDICLETGLSR
jgi:hypothetical protein